MSLLAQCGFGRGNKIEQGLGEGVIKGVIMSPRDERRDRLEASILDWGGNNSNALILFDPQFYAANLNNPRDGHLSEYDYYKNNNRLGRTQFSGTRIQGYVKDCLDYQHDTLGNNVSYLVSPTISFDDFRDSWSQIALNMAAESADYYSGLVNPQSLLLSLVITESAFRSKDDVDEFLDALTELDTHGFYIIVRRDSGSPNNAMGSVSFANFMYFCHVLAVINEYEVMVGYSDWHSFLLEAVGVTHTATGWYQNLRQFSLDRFVDTPGGGRRPLKRYSSAPLLSSPLITPELQGIYLANLLTGVLSGSNHDPILINGPTPGEGAWSDEISCLAHWFSLNSISQRINVQPTTLGRIQEAERLMQNALTLYTQLGNQSISLEPSVGSARIQEWQDSLQHFRSLTGV